jgi:hypothetical protein
MILIMNKPINLVTFLFQVSNSSPIYLRITVIVTLKLQKKTWVLYPIPIVNHMIWIR